MRPLKGYGRGTVGGGTVGVTRHLCRHQIQKREAEEEDEEAHRRSEAELQAPGLCNHYCSVYDWVTVAVPMLDT